jgi:hypothetical protein
MDISILTNYLVIAVIAFCVCIGIIIKKIDNIPNRFIPLIMAIIGVLFNMWISKFNITPDVILAGLVSGLASTGSYEAVRNVIGYKDESESGTNA